MRFKSSVLVESEDPERLYQEKTKVNWKNIRTRTWKEEKGKGKQEEGFRTAQEQRGTAWRSGERTGLSRECLGSGVWRALQIRVDPAPWSRSRVKKKYTA